VKQKEEKTHFAEVQNKCEIWHTEAMARCIVRKEITHTHSRIYIYTCININKIMERFST